ncbi:MAG: hypothetical protein ACYTXY_38115, partial [Nostoc sp.]
MSMRRLSMAALGVAFIAMATIPTLPAQAALLEFNFTTKSSGTGSFTLDTDTARDPNPALFSNPNGSFTDGISYPGAISDFTFSAPSRSFSNLSGDFGVFPSLPFTSNSKGVKSGLTSPAGCLTALDYSCPVGIDVK